MLPPFIIDEIRKREEREKHDPQQPFLELPLPTPASPRPPKGDEHGDNDRGVVIIDLGPGS